VSWPVWFWESSGDKPKTNCQVLDGFFPKFGSGLKNETNQKSGHKL
jgi:hypothetical protein